MKRRELVATAGAATLGALAGCSTASGTVRPPRPSEEKLGDGGWKQVDSSTETLFEKEYSVATVTATASTRVWEDAELRQELEEKTMGAVDTQSATYFSSRISTDPSLGGIPDFAKGEVKQRAEAEADEMFRARLSQYGEEIRKEDVSDTLSIDTGAEASLTKYTASVPLPDFEYPIGDDRTIAVENDGLTLEGYLATWIHDGAIFISGGVYPGENYTKGIQRNVTEAVSITVDVDLGLTPDAYKEELFGLIASTR